MLRPPHDCTEGGHSYVDITTYGEDGFLHRCVYCGHEQRSLPCGAPLVDTLVTQEGWDVRVVSTCEYDDCPHIEHRVGEVTKRITHTWLEGVAPGMPQDANPQALWHWNECEEIGREVRRL